MNMNEINFSKAMYIINATNIIKKSQKLEKEKNSILIMIKKMRDLMLCNY